MRELILTIVLLPAVLLVMSGCGAGSEAQQEPPTISPELIAEAQEHFDIAVALGRQGNLEDAISEFDEAIGINPQFATAYAIRALSYRLLGMDALAEQDVERAIELGLDRAEVDGLIGQLNDQS